MTARKPEKKKTKCSCVDSFTPDPESVVCTCGAYDYNQSRAEWTAYTDELLEPLEEMYMRNKGIYEIRIERQEINLLEQELWTAIKTVVEKHREALP